MENTPFSFTLETNGTDTVVEFFVKWGVVAAPDLEKQKAYSVDEWLDTAALPLS